MFVELVCGKGKDCVPNGKAQAAASSLVRHSCLALVALAQSAHSMQHLPRPRCLMSYAWTAVELAQPLCSVHCTVYHHVTLVQSRTAALLAMHRSPGQASIPV
jgi:hypothetical protein